MKFSNFTIPLSLSILIFMASFSATLKATEIKIGTDGCICATLSETIMTEAYARIGHRLKVTRYPSERALVNANEGIVDGELQRILGINKQYPNLVRVGVSLYEFSIVGVSNDGSIVLDGWDSLIPYKLATMRGGKLVQYNLQKFKGVKNTQLRTNQQIMKFVDAGRADIGVLNEMDALYLSQRLKLHNLQILDKWITRVAFYHYLHRRNQHLVPGLENVLRDMKQEGLIEKMEKNFMGSLGK